MTKWQQDMEQLHGKAEVIIGKQRHGPVGSIELSFEGRFTKFGNLVKPWQQGADQYELGRGPLPQAPDTDARRDADTALDARTRGPTHRPHGNRQRSRSISTRSPPTGARSTP
jgi:hypothetical protein